MTQAQLSLRAQLAMDKNLSLSAGYIGSFGQYEKTHAAQLQLAYQW